MTVGAVTTDTGGNYFRPTLQASSFTGPYVRIVDACGDARLLHNNGLDWGENTGTDCESM